jgi:hypothetical protein
VGSFYPIRNATEGFAHHSNIFGGERAVLTFLKQINFVLQDESDIAKVADLCPIKCDARWYERE